MNTILYFPSGKTISQTLGERQSGQGLDFWSESWVQFCILALVWPYTSYPTALITTAVIYNVLPYWHTADTLLALRPGSYYVICITVIITLQRRGRQEQQMDHCTYLIGDEQMASNCINYILLGFLTWYSYKQQYPKYFLLRHPWISPSQSNLPTTARLTFLKYCYSWMFVLECSVVYYYLLN